MAPLHLTTDVLLDFLTVHRLLVSKDLTVALLHSGLNQGLLYRGTTGEAELEADLAEWEEPARRPAATTELRPVGNSELVRRDPIRI